MAFNPALLVKLQPSSLFTDPATIPNVAVSPLVPQQWLYNGNGDTIATIMTAGYFNVFANWTNTLEYNNGQYFRVGDSIYIVGEDGNAFIQVATVGATITTTSLPPGPLSVTNADVAANAAIAFSKLAALPSTDILVGSAGNVATAVAMTGDVTISNTGVTTIGSGTVTGSKIAATTITGANLVANTITATQLATSVPQVARVVVSSANFKTAYTAGIALIAAAGSNTIIVVDKATFTFNYLTAAYTAGGAIGLQYSTSAPVNAGGIAASATIAAVDVTGLSAAGYESVVGALAINGTSNLVNAGLWLTVATQNFASGSGAVDISIHYHVITI